MRTLLTMLGIIIGIASVNFRIVVVATLPTNGTGGYCSLVRILLMSIPGKIFVMTIAISAGVKVRRLASRSKNNRGSLQLTPAVSQNLRLRYNNVDVAASANGVSGD
ncbi:hypothetical protein ACNKHM_02235 [Shigella sonnei]